MNRQPTTVLKILALSDLTNFLALGWMVAWHFANHYLPLSSQLILLGVAFLLQRRYQRVFKALARLARRVTRSQSPAERQWRYRWVCLQFAVMAVGIALAIPFGFRTAAFWCIYLTVLVVLVVLLESARQDLFQPA